MRIKGMQDTQLGELYQFPEKRPTGSHYLINGPHDTHGVVVGQRYGGGIWVRGTKNENLIGKYGIF